MVAPDGERFKADGTYRDARARAAFMTWRWEEDKPEEEHDTQLKLECNEQDGGTELVLTHEQFASVESRGRHERGWTIMLDQFGAVA